MLIAAEWCRRGNKKPELLSFFKIPVWVELGCTKSNFIKGLKAIENYMQMVKYK